MLPPNPSSLFRQHQGIGSSGLARGLDPMTVGQSIFGESPLLAPPVVRGFSQFTCLAQGGFGRVWRARRDADASLVALKIPHQTDPETAERLEQEAEALQSLDHPHIVRLLELTEDAAGHPVIVMELVEGPSLTERLPREGFDFDHALQIFLPVLEAVAHAHSRGVVHRDLKPSNILLAADSTPKVSDFGLALSLKDQRVAFSMTRSGVLAGTVEYLAPERYEPGGESSTAADIFALGVILYELLTGRPPRGAWQPLSQIKHLDLRLDELLAEAIHPDPAKRLPSAVLFRQRLEAIWHSRPRYAGTPLLTRPIRYADVLWTVGGLYFLAAAFCSLLSINNTRVPAVFDLTFHHTKLLGGFWALWILVPGMGVLWVWQAIRLWRFRCVPIREALPSPFGLRLGGSHGVVVLVALAQILCAWAPLAYIIWIYSQVWFWATPETPVWERVLGVTRWGSETPISPWTWDPANLFNGGSYWIREMQPGLTPGTWRLHDRQSFFIFTQPLVMAFGAAGICAGLLTTCVGVISAWGRRHTARLILFLAASCGAGFSLGKSVRFEQATRTNDRNDGNLISIRLHEEQVAETGRLLNAIFDAVVREGTALPAETAAAVAPFVSIENGVQLDRTEFLRRLEEQRRLTALQRQSLEDVCSWIETLIERGRFQWAFSWEAYTDPPGGPATGEFFRLACGGALSVVEPGGYLSLWARASAPLYSADRRTLTADEATDWLTAFLHTLSTKGCPDLEQFLLPIMLSVEPSDSRRYVSASRETTTSALRASRDAWNLLTLSPAATPVLRELPGARWELTCNLLQSGTRRGGHRKSAVRPLHWQTELVFTENRWQALRIRM